MTNEYTQVLDLMEQGDWDDAHHLTQDYNDELSCLLHGYLYREGGDLSNANYWYSGIGQCIPIYSLEEEYKRLYQMTATNF